MSRLEAFNEKKRLFDLEILHCQVQVLHELVLVDSHVVLVCAVVELLLISHQRLIVFRGVGLSEIGEQGLISEHVECLGQAGTLTPAQGYLF